MWLVGIKWIICYSLEALDNLSSVTRTVTTMSFVAYYIKNILQIKYHASIVEMTWIRSTHSLPQDHELGIMNLYIKYDLNSFNALTASRPWIRNHELVYQILQQSRSKMFTAVSNTSTIWSKMFTAVSNTSTIWSKMFTAVSNTSTI